MFRYTADFPTNNIPSSKIMRKLGVKKFSYEGLGSALFSKVYVSLEHGYELSFDHDMGFVKFNNDLNDKIGAILDEITDIVGAKRGEYTIIDDATGDEVCLDALNDVYPASKYKRYRYSVRLFPNNAKSIKQSIMIALPNIVFSDDNDEETYNYEKYDIDLDGNESVCFYFTSEKLDINYINSIIYPVMKALGYRKFDYVVDDYATGEEIPCEANDADQSSCSSYEFGQPTQDEAEKWLNEIDPYFERQLYKEEQEQYIYNVYNNIRETKYANMCESDAEEEDDDEWLPPAEQRKKEAEKKRKANEEEKENKLYKEAYNQMYALDEVTAKLESEEDNDSDDEWLPPAEQRKKDRKIASAKKRAEKKALKEKIEQEIQREKEAKKAEREAKKANMTEEEKAAYAAKVEAIIADRRAKKALRLQQEEQKAIKEEIESLQKKLERLHRQLN